MLKLFKAKWVFNPTVYKKHLFRKKKHFLQQRLNYFPSVAPKQMNKHWIASPLFRQLALQYGLHLEKKVDQGEKKYLI